MQKSKILGSILLPWFIMVVDAAPSRAAGCEDMLARHMVGEAMLAAQFVAAAEKGGLAPVAINAALKDVAEKSAIQEFWITDSNGHAYLTNTGIDFTFSRDPAKQPQASVFWPLLDGGKKVVIQDARKREIDNKVFKYVAVAGVDKPCIVQVGVAAATAEGHFTFVMAGLVPAIPVMPAK
jgi:hypothetical protein